MRWQDKVAHRYTDAHIKVMALFDKHRLLYQTEDRAPIFVLSDRRGDHIIPDIYLLLNNEEPCFRDVRVECDDYGLKTDMDPYLDKDYRLLEIHGVKTVRLDNHKTMLVKGEQYIMGRLHGTIKSIYDIETETMRHEYL